MMSCSSKHGTKIPHLQALHQVLWHFAQQTPSFQLAQHADYHVTMRSCQVCPTSPSFCPKNKMSRAKTAATGALFHSVQCQISCLNRQSCAKCQLHSRSLRIAYHLLSPAIGPQPTRCLDSETWASEGVLTLMACACPSVMNQ